MDHIQVEFDLSYWGGDYSGVGSFLYIPYHMVENFLRLAEGTEEDKIGRAFEFYTRHVLDNVVSRMHIVSYDLDNHYTSEGEMIEEGSVERVDRLYSLCTQCDHFVDPNDCEGEGLADYVHLDDGEQEYDHNATPGDCLTLDEWRKVRPDLFVEHSDGKIGPNSVHHSRRGKED